MHLKLAPACFAVDTEARSSVAARPLRVKSGNLAMEHLLAVAEQETLAEQGTQHTGALPDSA